MYKTMEPLEIIDLVTQHPPEELVELQVLDAGHSMFKDRKLLQ